MSDDEGKWDREQQHLDDHHYDLIHEERRANCEHEEYKITDIIDITGYNRKEPSVDAELTCLYCGKTNCAELPLAQVLDLLNNFLFDYRLTCTIQDDGAWV